MYGTLRHWALIAFILSHSTKIKVQGLTVNKFTRKPLSTIQFMQWTVICREHYSLLSIWSYNNNNTLHSAVSFDFVINFQFSVYHISIYTPHRLFDRLAQRCILAEQMYDWNGKKERIHLTGISLFIFHVFLSISGVESTPLDDDSFRLFSPCKLSTCIFVRTNKKNWNPFNIRANKIKFNGKKDENIISRDVKREMHLSIDNSSMHFLCYVMWLLSCSKPFAQNEWNEMKWKETNVRDKINNRNEYE